MRGLRPLVVALMLVPSELAAQSLPGTQPLTTQGDLAAKMVDGIGRYLDLRITESASIRAAHWLEISRAAPPNDLRSRFRQILGIERGAGLADLKSAARLRPDRIPDGEPIARGKGYAVYSVTWSTGRGLITPGLWLRPNGKAVAHVVAVPDCANTPEQIVGLAEGVPPEAQFARRLAESGCSVLVPLLVGRTPIGRIEELFPGRDIDIPHREFLYRAFFELGQSLTALEVESVVAAGSWLGWSMHGPSQTGVIGFGEGGRIALYAAAAEPALFEAACVSGYFRGREGLWSEPIDRNVFGLLNMFGDAEIAAIAAGFSFPTRGPNSLIVEASRHPEWRMGPQGDARGGRQAAPGMVETPPLTDVTAEVERAHALASKLNPRARIELVLSEAGKGLPGSDAALRTLLKALNPAASLKPSGRPAALVSRYEPPSPYLYFRQHVDYSQALLRQAGDQRRRFWQSAKTVRAEEWSNATSFFRDYLWERVIGKLPKPEVPPGPRSRLVYDEPKYRGYEVTLDVNSDVFAYGILLVPKDLKEGEKRPVVVCQHGLEGTPKDLADPRVDHPAYHRYACRLAERGFVVFAPQNPYIGGDRFRVLQRKANPLGLSLFSFITRQHERILEWLGTLPFVDPKRIGFYGLSYGGKTAMRVPALLEGYCLSICSADYNEWIWKNVSSTSPYSYLFTNEYEMPEWNLANTFNYAEMSWLIAPRPFMVERGHKDGVAPDEWVAYEYARTRRKYVELGIGGRTEIEFFDGPHTINGVGSFAFLHKHLQWPAPPEKETSRP